MEEERYRRLKTNILSAGWMKKVDRDKDGVKKERNGRRQTKRKGGRGDAEVEEDGRKMKMDTEMGKMLRKRGTGRREQRIG